MNKRKPRKAVAMTASALQKMEAFTFGEPVLVLDKRDILDYVECISNGKWYEPPVIFSGWQKACAQPYITARRFTLNATCSQAPTFRPRCCPVRISAALRSTIWYSASLREAMRNPKGLGNIKNLFFYAPGGKPDGIKIVPLSEVATKDAFFNIKKASAADLMDAHRVPFQLMGDKPENIGSMGDVEKVAKVFAHNELSPLQDRFREVNDWFGMEVIRFKEYTLNNPESSPLKPLSWSKPRKPGIQQLGVGMPPEPVDTSALQ